MGILTAYPSKFWELCPLFCGGYVKNILSHNPHYKNGDYDRKLFGYNPKTGNGDNVRGGYVMVPTIKYKFLLQTVNPRLITTSVLFFPSFFFLFF